MSTPDADYPVADDDHSDPAPIIDLADEVTALVDADRHLRAISKARHEHTVAAEVYDRELARIRDLRAEVLGVIERRIEWHETPVKALHAAILERDATRKTLRLPNGTLKATTHLQHDVEYVDVKAFCDWAEDNATDLVRWTAAPEKTAVKKAFTVVDTSAGCDGEPPYLVYVTTAGELVPGIVPVPPSTKFTVTPA